MSGSSSPAIETVPFQVPSPLFLKFLGRIERAKRNAQHRLRTEMDTIVKEMYGEVKADFEDILDSTEESLDLTQKNWLQELQHRSLDDIVHTKPSSTGSDFSYLSDSEDEHNENSHSNVIPLQMQSLDLTAGQHSVRDRLMHTASHLGQSHGLINAILGSLDKNAQFPNSIPQNLTQVKFLPESSTPKKMMNPVNIRKRNYSEVFYEEDDNEKPLIINEDESSLHSEGEISRKGHNILVLSLKCQFPGCSQYLAGKEQLNIHMRAEHGVQTYRCLQAGCFTSFQTKDGLSHHIRVDHGLQTEWTCPRCFKQFKKYEFMSRHVQWIHYEGQFQCAHDPVRPCPFVGETRGKVYAHYKISHMNFTCNWPDCGRSFKQLNNLKRHQRMHQRIKPYRCTWENCNYESEFRSTILNHVRMRHFNLPPTIKEQIAKGIVDDRDPRQYLFVKMDLL